jgi:threonine/homoserine/homoserine lactone efflux protein
VEQLVPSLEGFLLFLAVALLLAVTPGPGIFYVATRTLAGGQEEGLASSFGTAIGGCIHVIGGAVGISALVVASAEAFAVLKTLGAAYLTWLGCKTIWQARGERRIEIGRGGSHRAFRDGVVVEALNPKTAAFFLALIPQFVDPSRHVAMQFVVLGLICVVLNTAADIVVVHTVARARSRLEYRPGLIMRLRQSSGVAMCTLGASLLLARRSA